VTVTYVTPADVRQTVAPDGDVTGSCGELDDNQLQRAIQRAQDRVDGATGRSFDDANVPSLLAGVTLAMTIFYATLTYRKSHDLAQYDPIFLQYQDAIGCLKDIQTGVIQYAPVPDSAASDPTPSRPRPMVINPTPLNGQMFGMEDLGLSAKTSGTRGIIIGVDSQSGQIWFQNPVTGSVWAED
jgi:hypothetical protein